MARINIDDKIHRDRRFCKLVEKLNGDRYKALGLLVGAWTMAQDFMSDETNGLIPMEEWDEEPFELITEVRLAEVREGGVYVKGSKDAFLWLAQKSEAGKKGGQKSAEARRNKTKQNEAPASSASSEPKQEQADAGFCSSETKPLTLAPALPPTPTPTPTCVLTNTNPHSPPGENALAFKTAEQMTVQELLERNQKLGIAITPDHVVDLFNTTVAGTCKLKPCFGLGAVSMKNMLDTFEKFQTLDHWKTLFEKVLASDMMTGRIETKFLATLDWLAKKENALKAMSGKYDNTSDADFFESVEPSEEDLGRLRAAGEI